MLSPSPAAAAATAPQIKSHLSKKHLLVRTFIKFVLGNGPRAVSYIQGPPSAPYLYPPPLSLQVTKGFETRGFSLSGFLLTKDTTINYKEKVGFGDFLSKSLPPPNPFS